MTADVPVAIADTSALIAFFASDDKHHAAVRDAVAATGHLVASPCILAELDYLLATRQSHAVSNAALGYIASRVASGRWEVPDIGQSLLASHAVMQDYPSIGLSDATNAVLARQFRTNVLLTLDMRHFRMVRPLTPHEAFRLLPADGD